MRKAEGGKGGIFRFSDAPKNAASLYTERAYKEATWKSGHFVVISTNVSRLCSANVPEPEVRPGLLGWFSSKTWYHTDIMIRRLNGVNFNSLGHVYANATRSSLCRWSPTIRPPETTTTLAITSDRTGGPGCWNESDSDVTEAFSKRGAILLFDEATDSTV